MTGEIDRAARAKALLESSAFNEAMEGVRKAIFDRIERCPISESETAEDLRRCLKLLRDVRLNLEVAIKEGAVKEFELKKDEESKSKRKLGIIPGFFR